MKRTSASRDTSAEDGGVDEPSQLRIIDYLREENLVLCEQLGARRVRLNDDQRRRLAAKAKVLGRMLPAEVARTFTSRGGPCRWPRWNVLKA
jgi:hypothetical protein